MLAARQRAQKRRKLTRATQNITRRATPPKATNGTVIPLTMVNSAVWDVAYTVPIQVGASKQNFSLQVDTGSSDTWIASTKCDSESCSRTQGHRMNPDNARSTGESLKLNYLAGEFAGPIYWDLFELGGYKVAAQALVLANNVQDEALGPLYSGILGVGPPANSVIATKIPPKEGDTPDGATVLSNVYGTSPAPSSRFISLVLERPGDPTYPSLLGLGAHPSNVIPSLSSIQYIPVVADNAGPLFWKAFGDKIQVYVDDKPVTVDINRQVIFDSGVSIILATPSIAAGLYGALGISGNQDGSYTVPCSTALNISILIDGITTPIPLHPLDTTSPPNSNPNALSCQGTIRAMDLSSLPGDVGMILGVAFLRNVYTVLAADRSAYMNVTRLDDDDNGDDDDGLPQIGLLPLTNVTRAMEDFKRVRLQQLPIATPTSTNVPSDEKSGTIEGSSVGLYVGIAVGALTALVIILFGIRWCCIHRRAKRDGALGPGAKGPYTSAPTEEPYSSNVLLARALQDRTDSYHSSSTGTLIGSISDNGATPRLYKKGHKGKAYNPNDPWDPRNYSMSFRSTDYDEIPMDDVVVTQYSPTTSPTIERENVFFASDPLVPILNPEDPRGSILTMMAGNNGHGRRGSDHSAFSPRLPRFPPTASRSGSS